MRSTGEVMGIDEFFGIAFAKSQAAAYGELPTKVGPACWRRPCRDCAPATRTGSGNRWTF
jgi:hypothetical protein